MRLLCAAVLSLAVTVPGFALAAEPAEAQAGLSIVKSQLRRSAQFRSVKVNAEGDVCGLVSKGGDDDLQFMWFKSTGVIWVSEGEREENSLFVYGNPSIKRSTERPDYQIWKACSKGK